MKTVNIFITATLLCKTLFAQGWQSISNFGSNPGNIKGYQYVPADVPSNAPLVVVIHGCTQNAINFSNETEWNTLADKHKFYVAYAEQKSANNASSCFNYWESADNSRGQGEALSIKQLTDYMKSTYSIDSSKVFVTGLSAGGSMTVNMLSVYPDIFAAGAEMAGTPYRGAESSLEVTLVATGLVSKSPQSWGDLVRAQFPGFTGKYPHLAIFHGTSDIIINYNNAIETVKQFTNLHRTDQTADVTDNSFKGNSRVTLEEFHDTSGKPVVIRYTIDNMAHGIAVNPGDCYEEGGSTASNSIDVDFYSSFWAANFFGILLPPITISGADSVNINEQGLTFAAPLNAGSAYDWQVPEGATIISGQGSSSITVNWGSTSGIVSVTETSSSGCVFGPVELDVIAVQNPTGFNSLFYHEEILLSRTNENIFWMIRSAIQSIFHAEFYNIEGRIFFKTNVSANLSYSIPSNLQPGVYILRCVNEKSVQQKKFVY